MVRAARGAAPRRAAPVAASQEPYELRGIGRSRSVTYAAPVSAMASATAASTVGSVVLPLLVVIVWITWTVGGVVGA